jgi:prepilin-type N-terminal cleavage/methylation domain-containing protein
MIRILPPPTRGFTLIALLVVLVIIAILSYTQLVDKDGALRSKQSTDRAKPPRAPPTAPFCAASWPFGP